VPGGGLPKQARMESTDYHYPVLLNQRSKNIMKNWRTTFGGLLAALGQGLGLSLPPEYIWISQALVGIGVLVMGYSAVDVKQ
jgi:hypothetical protein